MPHDPLISIIEDDRSLRLATSSLLRSVGYATESFGSAEEFLGAGDLSRFDCIVTDIQMPGMSGIDLTHKLIADSSTTKVVLITARTEADIHNQARASGAVCMLQKPFAAESLIRCVEKALGSEGGGCEPS